MKKKIMFGNSKHRLTKGESCQTNLVNFYDEMTGDERRILDVCSRLL